MSRKTANIPDADREDVKAMGAEKDPSQWVTGDEPMTGAQESYVHTLARQTGHEDELPKTMTKAEASEKIEELQEERDGAGKGKKGK